MFSKLTLKDINSIGTYYYSLVSYMINLIKKYTDLEGNILMQNKNWSMQGSCTDGKNLYVLLWYKKDGDTVLEDKSFILKIFLRKVDGEEIYYLNDDYVADVSSIKHGSDMMYLPHLTLSYYNEEDKMVHQSSLATIVIVNSHKMMFFNPSTFEPSIKRSKNTPPSKSKLPLEEAFLYGTMDCFNETARTDFDIGDTYFKCVNKLSCFAYDEFKDVVLVNYYCNEKNFDNVPESERKKHENPSNGLSVDNLINSKILGSYRISDTSVRTDVSTQKYAKVFYTKYDATNNRYAKVPQDQYTNVPLNFTPVIVYKKDNIENITTVAQAMDSYKGNPILLRSGEYIRNSKQYTNVYGRLYFIKPTLINGKVKYNLEKYITLCTGTIEDNKLNFIEAENICHISRNNSSNCRFYIGYNRYGLSKNNTTGHMLYFDLDVDF